MYNYYRLFYIIHIVHYKRAISSNLNTTVYYK